jgi:hypothetical protein
MSYFIEKEPKKSIETISDVRNAKNLTKYTQKYLNNGIIFGFSNKFVFGFVAHFLCDCSQLLFSETYFENS